MVNINTQIWVKGLVVVIILFGVLTGAAGGCGWTAGRVGRAILAHRLKADSWDYRVFRKCTDRWGWGGILEKILGDKTFIVLLQNNYELRATGGFAGSYARIETDRTGIKQIFVQDIYVPDGQIAGHVEPPYPIQEAFGQGWWRLRDANWDPDWASAAATLKWFLQQGGEEKADGAAAVNMSTVRSIIEALGPMEVVTYGETVTRDNFYSKAQSYAQIGFEPGSTQKRDFLGAVGAAVEGSIKAAGPIRSLKLLKVLKEDLDEGQVTVWTEDKQLQEEIEKRGWGGRLEGGWDGQSDYIYIVESNLGNNKANCCVERRIVQEVDEEKEKVTAEWKNNNPFGQPKPPESWGGDYINYVRVIVPAGEEIKRVKAGEAELRRATKEDFGIPNALRQGLSKDIYAVEKRGGLQIIGFWVEVPAQESAGAEVELVRQRREGGKYKVLVKRQPGIERMPYKLVVGGEEIVSESMDKDRIFEAAR